MKLIERTKAQKIIEKIQSGRFDENDVDNLFMRLRAYSQRGSAFREMADFVAHNDKRDRGIFNQSLEAFYLSIKYFIDYVSTKRILDISKPFPLYIKKLMKYQVDKTDEDILRVRFNVTRQRLQTMIDNLFAEKKEANIAYIKQSKIDQGTFEAIRHVMSFIGSSPVIIQEVLIDQLIIVLRNNGFNFDESLIKEQGSKITLCSLLLLHETTFDYGGHKPGYCKITSEKTSIIYPTFRYVDNSGKEVEHQDEFGTLQVLGYVILDKNGTDLTVCYPIMSTILKTINWCDKSMFIIDPPTIKIDLGSTLSLTEEFRLYKT